MTRTLIDVDDELLEKATDILGVSTKKDAVNAALQEVVLREERAKGIEWLQHTSALVDLLDPEVAERARR